MNRTILALAASASAVILAPAASASDVDTVRGSVRVSDLDLTSAAGQEKLARRIANRARRLCDDGSGRLLGDPATDACIALAIAGTRRQVALATAHQLQTKQRRA